MRKRTKIVCTLGPSSETVTTITDMVKSGMNVARLNFSHGTREHHAMLIERVRQVEKKTGEPILIIQDLQGPKIRVGALPKEGVVRLQCSLLRRGDWRSVWMAEEKVNVRISGIALPGVAHDQRTGIRCQEWSGEAILDWETGG